jgi:hypothetical protein
MGLDAAPLRFQLSSEPPRLRVQSATWIPLPFLSTAENPVEKEPRGGRS